MCRFRFQDGTMKITNVEVARKFNLGNFETQDIKLTADLEEGDSIESAVTSLKNQIKLQGDK